MAKYTQGLYIDGEYFDVPFSSVKRNAEFLYRYAERTETGDLAADMIGVYFNYTVSFGIINNPSLHQRLFNKLTEPTPFHTLTFPDASGTYTYEAYLSNVSDEMDKIMRSGVRFRSLTAKFISKSPARRA